jgi:hypothetical protein
MSPHHHGYHTELVPAPDEARPPLRLLRGEATLHDLVADIFRGLRALAEAGLDVPHTLTTTATGLQLVVGDFTPPAPRPAPRPPLPEGIPMWYTEWAAFSELERDVLVLLIDEGGQSKHEIAACLQRSAEGLLGNVLANLAARRILHSGHEGYKFNLPANQREACREWLASMPESRLSRQERARREATGLTPDGQLRQDAGPGDEELAARIEAARAEKRGATS